MDITLDYWCLGLSVQHTSTAPKAAWYWDSLIANQQGRSVASKWVLGAIFNSSSRGALWCPKTIITSSIQKHLSIHYLDWKGAGTNPISRLKDKRRQRVRVWRWRCKMCVFGDWRDYNQRDMSHENCCNNNFAAAPCVNSHLQTITRTIWALRSATSIYKNSWLMDKTLSPLLNKI